MLKYFLNFVSGYPKKFFLYVKNFFKIISNKIISSYYKNYFLCAK